MKTAEKPNQTSQKIFAELKKAKSVAIFTHVNPDPDAYGSAFAFRQMCRNLGKTSDIFAVKNAKNNLDEIFPLQELRTDFKAADFDIAVIVDANEFSRIHKSFIEQLKKAKKIFCFDHHIQNVFDIKYSIVDCKCAACAQVITFFMKDNNQKITPEIATYLYTGLMGDTDRFLHNNLSHDVFETATILFDAGADTQFVYDKLYRNNTLRDFQIQQIFLKKTIFENGGKSCFTIFTLHDFKKLGVDQEFVKNFTNIAVNIVGVKASFLCIEYEKNVFKISIRTKGLNAQKLAISFGGGGHLCAAGFNFYGNKLQLKKSAKQWCKDILQSED